jgi:hypothetical protein
MTNKKVSVDAGIIWIGDPCYVMGQNASHGVKDWDDFCRKMDETDHWSSNGVSEPLGEGIGVVVSAGYGDGSYDVDVEHDGGRVKRVTVTFIEED